MRLSRPFDKHKRPHTLLSEASPYGSCHLLVEADATVSVAYLLDHEGGVRSSLWLANHEAAPQQLHHERAGAGLFPAMPAAHTRHPEGREHPRRRDLQVVWFEEGDGVAIREGDTVLGILPGTDPAAPNTPGYARDVLGKTPLGWSLDDALPRLGPQVEKAQEFWRWHESKDGWAEYQRAVLDHLEQHVGESGRYWSADGKRLPRIGVLEHPATAQRPFTVYSTVGMSCQQLPLTTGSHSPPRRRIELALATSRPTEASVDLLSWLASYPWRHRSWFAPGHVAMWDTEAMRKFPLGERWSGVLMLADPARFLGPRPLDLSGFTVHNDMVRWLWLVPVTGREHRLATEGGAESLLDELSLQGRDWVATI